MNDTEPSARDIAAFERDLNERKAKLLLFNKRAMTLLTRRMIETARRANVPVVNTNTPLARSAAGRALPADAGARSRARPVNARPRSAPASAALGGVEADQPVDLTADPGGCIQREPEKVYLECRPSKKSIKRMVENVHALTTRSGTWQQTTELVNKLNRR